MNTNLKVKLKPEFFTKVVGCPEYLKFLFHNADGQVFINFKALPIGTLPIDTDMIDGYRFKEKLDEVHKITEGSFIEIAVCEDHGLS